MPDLKCIGCDQKEERGCRAVRWRAVTPPNTDPREDWVNAAIVPVSIDGEEVYACPRQSMYEDPLGWDRLLFFYNLYKQGFLPDPGAVTEQCNPTMEMFRILDGVIGECDEAKMSEQNRPKGEPGR